MAVAVTIVLFLFFLFFMLLMGFAQLYFLNFLHGETLDLRQRPRIFEIQAGLQRRLVLNTTKFFMDALLFRTNHHEAGLQPKQNDHRHQQRDDRPFQKTIEPNFGYAETELVVQTRRDIPRNAARLRKQRQQTAFNQWPLFFTGHARAVEFNHKTQNQFNGQNRQNHQRGFRDRDVRRLRRLAEIFQKQCDTRRKEQQSGEEQPCARGTQPTAARLTARTCEITADNQRSNPCDCAKQRHRHRIRGDWKRFHPFPNPPYNQTIHAQQNARNNRENRHEVLHILDVGASRHADGFIRVVKQFVRTMLRTELRRGLLLHLLTAGESATASPYKTEQHNHQTRRAADAHHGAITIFRDQTGDHKHDQPRHGYRET